MVGNCHQTFVVLPWFLSHFKEEFFNQPLSNSEHFGLVFFNDSINFTTEKADKEFTQHVLYRRARDKRNHFSLINITKGLNKNPYKRNPAHFSSTQVLANAIRPAYLPFLWASSCTISFRSFDFGINLRRIKFCRGKMLLALV